MIGIIDYGAGNLRSVGKAFEFLGAPTKVIQGPADIKGVSRLVLPGVGAYAAALDNLHSRGIADPIAVWLKADRPFLGICLGLQLLFDESEEAPGRKGFGRFSGRALKFQAYKVPQIGWNKIQFEGSTGLLSLRHACVPRGDTIVQNINAGSYFFFLHSYYVVPSDPTITIASTRYGIEYAAAVQQGNVCGVQFHPEKSGDLGLQLLRNWIDHGD